MVTPSGIEDFFRAQRDYIATLPAGTLPDPVAGLGEGFVEDPQGPRAEAVHREQIAPGPSAEPVQRGDSDARESAGGRGADPGQRGHRTTR